MTFAAGFLVGIWTILLTGFVLALWLHVRKQDDEPVWRCADCADPITATEWFVVAPDGRVHMDCFQFGGRY